MSNLSGYDSEAVGFDSITLNKRPETSSSTQTTEFGECGVGSQTTTSRDCGSMINPEEFDSQDDLKEFPPPGLTEFLRRVVPAMMEQLDEDKELSYNSTDSEDEEMVIAKLFQEIKVADVSGIGAGDQATSVLAVSWSSAGNSLAVSVGRSQHENWCTHDGLIRIYTVKHTSGDKLVHAMDINEKNCVTSVKYHQSIAALFAYGTTTGEVVMCDLRNSNVENMTLTSPSGCHGSKRVSALKWADAPLANIFLTMQINNTGKRRGASDQILISTGSDGTMNVWQVNMNMRIFESVVLYTINGSRKMAAPDISCFDFVKSCPLQPCDEKVPDDVFVVGTKSGTLFLCKIKSKVMGAEVLDPVCEVLDGHPTCVLDVAFSGHKPGVFVSVSIDSELRVYDINQASPLKVFHIECPISCMSWLPANPCVCVLGLCGGEGGVLLYNVAAGGRVPVDGLAGGTVTAVDVNQSGTCRIACGDADSRVRVWELPSRRIRYSPDDLEF